MLTPTSGKMFINYNGGGGGGGNGGRGEEGKGEFSLRAGVTGSFYQIITARKINPRETQPRQRGLPASTVYSTDDNV